jgi:hypothetical protein
MPRRERRAKPAQREPAQKVRRWIKISKEGKVLKREVDAAIFGVPYCFINQQWRLSASIPSEGWVITHYWTGLKLGDFIFEDHNDAIRVAVYLTNKWHLNWNIKDSKKFMRQLEPQPKEKVKQAVRDEAKGVVHIDTRPRTS